MASKAIAFPKWKMLGIVGLFGLGVTAIVSVHAQESPMGRVSPSSTAPAYSGAATEGGPGSISSATGERVPDSPVPLTSGASGPAQQSGQSGQQPMLNNADRNLMRTLAQIHMAEIDMGKMAQSRSEDIQVRSFAQRMIDDHSQALEELQQLADAKGVVLPGGPDKKHAAAKEKLTAMMGDEFAWHYMLRAGDAAHKEAHQLLQQAVQSAQDPQLKAHMEKSLAQVEQHLQIASHMIAKNQSRLRGAQASGSSAPEQDASNVPGAPPRGGVPAAPGSAPR